MTEYDQNIEKIQKRKSYTFKKRYFFLTSSIFFIKIWWKILKYKNYFDTISPDYPLTFEQKLAVLSEEKRNLVIAGAGTGKTSVMIAKAGYLIEKKKIHPDELLLLSFGKEPQELLKTRGKDYLKIDLNANTFHAYGLKLVKEVYPEIKLSKFDDSSKSENLSNFIFKKLKSLKKDDVIFTLLVKYFSEYMAPPPNLEEESFKTLNEYQNYIRTIQKLTLNGDNVKSYGELRIANFLATRGIDYEYERVWDGEPLGNIYRPDFTAFYPNNKTKKITIEYFGIDRDGNTKPGILPKKYNSQMNSKKSFHNTQNTDFIALHYYDLQEGKLENKLDAELKKRGIVYQPISQQQLLEKFNERNYYDTFSKITNTFLTQFKSNQLKISDLKSKAGSDPRSNAYIEIFEWILHQYEQELKKDNAKDYSDMISDGIRILNENLAERKIKWIIIDEFQDISRGRTNLLYALIKQNPKVKILVVGDDWQSIYRFAGSDISLVQKFEYFFNNSVEFRLNMSFRFNSEINKFSQFFIMDKFYKRNSSVQIKKNIRVLKNRLVNPYKIFLHWRNLSSQKKEVSISEVVERIKKNKNKDSDKLYVLARYNQNLPDEKEMIKIKKIWGENVSSMTIHKAKGEEAEFVIITDLHSSFLSFPSEHHNDPLLNLVLASYDKKDLEIKGEERRLFYVAVTRAKHEVHLISDWSNPSIFIDEILNYASKGANHIYEWGKENQNNSKCPECSGNVTGKKCSNSMFCDFKAPLCQVCNSPCVLSNGYLFSCINCNFYYEVCKEQGCNGQLIPKVPNNPSEKSEKIFVGCSNFNLKKCEYSSFEIDAVCPKCGDGNLVKRNKKRNNVPFICCEMYECDFYLEFKNPIYKNSHLVSEYY